MIKEINKKIIEIYADQNGFEPFVDWLEKLKDVVGRKRIIARTKRLEQGNYGDCKSLGEGVFELKMKFGPGYRVYFAEKSDVLVLLLCGGGKGSQGRY